MRGAGLHGAVWRAVTLRHTISIPLAALCPHSRLRDDKNAPPLPLAGEGWGEGNVVRAAKSLPSPYLLPQAGEGEPVNLSRKRERGTREPLSQAGEGNP